MALKNICYVFSFVKTPLNLVTLFIVARVSNNHHFHSEDKEINPGMNSLDLFKLALLRLIIALQTEGLNNNCGSFLFKDAYPKDRS